MPAAGRPCDRRSEGRAQRKEAEQVGRPRAARSALRSALPNLALRAGTGQWHVEGPAGHGPMCPACRPWTGRRGAPESVERTASERRVCSRESRGRSAVGPPAMRPTSDAAPACAWERQPRHLTRIACEQQASGPGAQQACWKRTPADRLEQRSLPGPFRAAAAALLEDVLRTTESGSHHPGQGGRPARAAATAKHGGSLCSSAVLARRRYGGRGDSTAEALESANARARAATAGAQGGLAPGEANKCRSTPIQGS